MTLSRPSYIPLELSKAAKVKHDWDNWDPYSLLGTQSEETQTALSHLSDRAQIAYSIGCAEWVIWRFEGLSGELRPYEILEASWAGEMSADLVAPPQLNHREWEGPIRGPMDLALVTILNAFYSSESGNAQEDAAFAERISLHVLAEKEPFHHWRAQVLDRLERFFPRDVDNPIGKAVPREALDPTLPMSEESRGKLVNLFFENLDVTANPLLRAIRLAAD